MASETSMEPGFLEEPPGSLLEGTGQRPAVAPPPPDESAGLREPVAASSGEATSEALAALRQLLFDAQQREDGYRTTTLGLAHDLRNLLCIISGHAELAREELPDQHPVQRDLEAILAASQRAAALAAPLMSPAFQSSAPLAPLPLDQAIQGVCALLERLCGRSVSFCRVLRSVAPVWMDPGQIERVLINLVLNARDAMPAGGSIVVETDDVLLSAAGSQRLQIAAGPYALLRVTDTGLGMTSETRNRIFQPFFTTKSPDAGAGLGLATVRALVQQAGGAIDVKSELGAGTSFGVYLPAATLREPVLGQAFTSSEARAYAPHGGADPGLPCPVSVPASPPKVETLLAPEGRVVLGWVAPGVFLASFHGRLTDDLGSRYARRVEELLDGRTGVRYYIDASRLDSFELTGRTAAMRAIVSRAESLASVLVLNWSGGESPTARGMLLNLKGRLRVTDDRSAFDRELIALAPFAAAVL